MLLDMMKERGIKGTFFLVGKNVAEYPEIAQRIVAEGHEVANHSWAHPQLTKLAPDALKKRSLIPMMPFIGPQAFKRPLCVPLMAPSMPRSPNVSTKNLGSLLRCGRSILWIGKSATPRMSPNSSRKSRSRRHHSGSRHPSIHSASYAGCFRHSQRQRLQVCDHVRTHSLGPPSTDPNRSGKHSNSHADKHSGRPSHSHSIGITRSKSYFRNDHP